MLKWFAIAVGFDSYVTLSAMLCKFGRELFDKQSQAQH